MLSILAIRSALLRPCAGLRTCVVSAAGGGCSQLLAERFARGGRGNSHASLLPTGGMTIRVTGVFRACWFCAAHVGKVGGGAGRFHFPSSFAVFPEGGKLPRAGGHVVYRNGDACRAGYGAPARVSVAVGAGRRESGHGVEGTGILGVL